MRDSTYFHSTTWLVAYRKETISIILLNIAKAFDKVPHRRLLHNLNYNEINGATLQMSESFLSFRKQRRLVEGMSSNIADAHSGVLQDTVMVPLLFLSYIKDLPKVVTFNVSFLRTTVSFIRQSNQTTKQSNYSRT